MISMPEAFHSATDDLPFADVADHAGEETDVVFVVYGAMIHLGPQDEVLATGDAESHLRDWPAAVRAQGKRLPNTFPIGGAMRYQPF
jgi:hypothetical protein